MVQRIPSGDGVRCYNRKNIPPSVFNIPRSSNGRTAAFGAVNRGSNPCRGANSLTSIPTETCSKSFVASCRGCEVRVIRRIQKELFGSLDVGLPASSIANRGTHVATRDYSYFLTSGLRQRSRLNLAKSLSAEQSSAPCSMARAAR